MSLSERLDSARRAQQPAPAAGPLRVVPTGPEDPFAAVKSRVHNAMIDELGPKLYDPNMPAVDLEIKVRQALQTIIDAEQTPLSLADRTRISQEVSDEILGHGPLEPLLRDPEITEIMVNGPTSIYVERAGKIFPVPASFASDAHLRRTIDKIVGRVGRRIDEASPLVDARLPDGSRVNAVISPIALDGSVLTVRKFSPDPFTDRDLLAFGTFTPQVRDFLDLCIRGRRNILISGGTGSGKTTTLNVLSGYIPVDERIITIEDSAELQLRQRHVLRLEARPSNIEGRGQVTIRDLVRNALRMRPDRVIVGEVRDGAALDMLQAMNTGHDGSVTTIHANSTRDSVSRLETMVLMAGVELPVRAIRDQVASAIDLIVHQARMRDGSRRIVAISEVSGMESEIVTLQDLYTFDYGAGRDDTGRFQGSLVPTGLRPKFTSAMHDQGVDLPPHLFARGFG